jgi:hypothetical protein
VCVRVCAGLFCSVLLRQGFATQTPNLFCNPGWPHIHDPPTSASRVRVRVLSACTCSMGVFFIFYSQGSLSALWGQSQRECLGLRRSRKPASPPQPVQIQQQVRTNTNRKLTSKIIFLLGNYYDTWVLAVFFKKYSRIVITQSPSQQSRSLHNLFFQRTTAYIRDIKIHLLVE